MFYAGTLGYFAMYQGMSGLQASMLSSALEHTVPEQMFSTATQKAQAVSTVKLLNLAAQQGIAILHITPANSAITIPSLKLAPEVITEIQTAVAVGKEVIVHQSNITAFGWTGAGYVVLDPVAGDAAWRISGVGNGASFVLGVIVGMSISLLIDFYHTPNPVVLNAILLSLMTAITAMVILIVATQLVNLHDGVPITNNLGMLFNCFRSGFGFGSMFSKIYTKSKYVTTFPKGPVSAAIESFLFWIGATQTSAIGLYPPITSGANPYTCFNTTIPK